MTTDGRSIVNDDSKNNLIIVGKKCWNQIRRKGLWFVIRFRYFLDYLFWAFWGLLYYFSYGYHLIDFTTDDDLNLQFDQFFLSFSSWILFNRSNSIHTASNSLLRAIFQQLDFTLGSLPMDLIIQDKIRQGMLQTVKKSFKTYIWC